MGSTCPAVSGVRMPARKSLPTWHAAASRRHSNPTNVASAETSTAALNCGTPWRWRRRTLVRARWSRTRCVSGQIARSIRSTYRAQRWPGRGERGSDLAGRFWPFECARLILEVDAFVVVLSAARLRSPSGSAAQAPHPIEYILVALTTPRRYFTRPEPIEHRKLFDGRLAGCGNVHLAPTSILMVTWRWGDDAARRKAASDHAGCRLLGLTWPERLDDVEVPHGAARRSGLFVFGR